jgi:hypothetical protein
MRQSVVLLYNLGNYMHPLKCCQLNSIATLLLPSSPVEAIASKNLIALLKGL